MSYRPATHRSTRVSASAACGSFFACRRIGGLALCVGLVFALTACAGTDTILSVESTAVQGTEDTSPAETSATPESTAVPVTTGTETSTATPAASSVPTAASGPAQTSAVETTAAPKMPAVICAASPVYPNNASYNFN